MIVTIQEMQTVVAEYKLRQITDHNDEITLLCLRAAEQRVLSYLDGRYSISGIRALKSDDPNIADLKEIIKDIALYLIIRRHNVDMLYDRVAELYKLHIEYLSQIAQGKISLPGLPTAFTEEGAPKARLELGSRPKRDFQF